MSRTWQELLLVSWTTYKTKIGCNMDAFVRAFDRELNVMARYNRLHADWNPDTKLEAAYFERNVHAFPFSSSTSFVGAWRVGLAG